MSFEHFLSSDSFLEYAFLRWVLTPALELGAVAQIKAQYAVLSDDNHHYRLDYAFLGQQRSIAIELDGWAFHSQRNAFNNDRLRQNDLHILNWIVLRFTYDMIRTETARCVDQLQALLKQDSYFSAYLIQNPKLIQPEMHPDPLFSMTVSNEYSDSRNLSYFQKLRGKLHLQPLRRCQIEAYTALGNYFLGGSSRAACVMSVGSGKTALGVVACLAFTRKRALIITPGRVIRGTFNTAFDDQNPRNVLYGLPRGPLLPGSSPPSVLTLDRDDGPISHIRRQTLLKADIIITNFHSLGDASNGLLEKLRPEDIDMIIVDEAHIAAAESYQRVFAHFAGARSLLMSACFQRLDGKTIDADVVYRYSLADSIEDEHAKKIRVHCFCPQEKETTYEIHWPDGRYEEIRGREALLDVITDERKLAHITARSDVSIRRIMEIVKPLLVQQEEILYPIRPRVLFAALGALHAQQIATVAIEYGIPCDYLHHSLPETRIKAVRNRFEMESGDLQGIVQIKMLGQGYDFPPITIVVPMRPYGSFSEFYQFMGRGIRILTHQTLDGQSRQADQFLDLVYHAELNLDQHIEKIYEENEMNPNQTTYYEPPSAQKTVSEQNERMCLSQPAVQTVSEQGFVQQHILYDHRRLEQGREEREKDALAQRYAVYAQQTTHPISFEQYVQVMRKLYE